MLPSKQRQRITFFILVFSKNQEIANDLQETKAVPKVSEGDNKMNLVRKLTHLSYADPALVQ